MATKEVHMAKYEDGDLKSPARASISPASCTVKLRRDRAIKSRDLVDGEIAKEEIRE
mgnify:FL=1